MTPLYLHHFLHCPTAKQVNAQRGIEARGRKHAEALDHAKVSGGDNFHAQRADKHHGKRNGGTYTVRVTILALDSGGNDNGQRYDGQQHHQNGDDHVHHILKRPGIAAVTQWEHPIPDRRDPLHDGEQINARTEQLGFLALDADTDDRDANNPSFCIKDFFMVLLLKKTQYRPQHAWSALRLCVWLFGLDDKIFNVDNALMPAFRAEQGECL